MASQFANGKDRKSNREGRRTVQSLPSIIFYRASTYRQARTQSCPRTRAWQQIINHYYLGVIFLRYNFVCLPPRVGARACTPWRRGQGSVSKSGAGSSLFLLPSERPLPPRFLLRLRCVLHRLLSATTTFSRPRLLFFLLYFMVRELSTSTLCVHTPAASLASKSTCFPHRWLSNQVSSFCHVKRSFRPVLHNFYTADQIARIFMVSILHHIVSSWFSSSCYITWFDEPELRLLTRKWIAKVYSVVCKNNPLSLSCLKNS